MNSVSNHFLKKLLFSKTRSGITENYVKDI